MKSYNVAVLYCTQRNNYSIQLQVKANNPTMAKYIVFGIILNYEHNQKDRYIKIKSYEVVEVMD